MHSRIDKSRKRTCRRHAKNNDSPMRKRPQEIVTPAYVRQCVLDIFVAMTYIYSSKEEQA